MAGSGSQLGSWRDAALGSPLVLARGVVTLDTSTPTLPRLRKGGSFTPSPVRSTGEGRDGGKTSGTPIRRY